MGWEAVLCFFVLGLIITGLILNLSPDALMLGGLVIVTVAEITSPEEALSGFSNPAVLTVGALYVVAAALRQTGAIDRVGQWLFGRSNSERGVLVRMAVVLPGMSAFLNNTPIVAMFIPVLLDWCRKHRVAPSRLLIPLSYLCIFGGTCTLIGTSTNIVVNGLMQETARSSPELADGLSPIGFFELGRLGLPYAIIGVLYILFIGHRLLPHRMDPMEEITSMPREYLVNLMIEPDCRLVGQTIEQAGLRHLAGLFLIELTRQGHTISPVSPDYVLRGSDFLTFTGVVGTIVDLEKIPGLVSATEAGYSIQTGARTEELLCEAVVSPTCPSVGKTIRDADFRALYNAAVLAVHRGGERLTGKVGDIVLRPGDTLLLRAGTHFRRANRNNPHFLLIGGVEGSYPVRYEKAIWSLILLCVLVLLLTSGTMRTVTTVLLVAALMVGTRCISVADARRSVNWQTLIAIAAALGLAKALVNSGSVAFVAGGLVDLTESAGSYAVLAGVYVMTSLFTAVVTNNAAAALVFPFAVAIAAQIGANPRPFVMTVAFAASASFISPLAYQTNLMVYGPGGYKVTDFVRIGLPLNILLFILATILVPQFWPF